MALTINGKHTGVAARIERADQAEWRRHLRDEYNKKRFQEAMQKLIEADPDGWEAWYDDDRNIPPILRWWNTEEITLIVERILNRVNELKSLSQS